MVSVESNTTSASASNNKGSPSASDVSKEMGISISDNVEVAASSSSATHHQTTIMNQPQQLEAAADSSTSSESTEEISSQINNNNGEGNQQPDINEHSIADEEMAIVSETMANASLANGGDSGGVGGSCAVEQRPRGAVVSEAANRLKKDPETALAAVVAAASSIEKKQLTKPARQKKRTPPPVQPGQTTGRWTHEEHEAFLQGLKIFGREWKKVAVKIPTRSSAQVRSHAQKYFSKLARDEQLMSQEHQAYEAAASAAQAATSASTSGSAASDASEGAAPMVEHSPAVQRSVERILADPEQAQRDVEDTLRALRERYSFLQQRLQEAPSSRQGSPSNVVEDEDDDGDGEEENDNNEQPQENGGAQQQPQQQPRSNKLRRGEGDEDCSMGSSASALSSLGNEELIALSVLGGTLPNSHARSPANANGGGEPSGALPRHQSDSSLESADTDTNQNPKRKREEK